jgi:hypothetical protein
MPVVCRAQAASLKHFLTYSYFYLQLLGGLFMYLPRITAPEYGADFPNKSLREV